MPTLWWHLRLFDISKYSVSKTETLFPRQNPTAPMEDYSAKIKLF